jgi:hypothetical protein
MIQEDIDLVLNVDEAMLEMVERGKDLRVIVSPCFLAKSPFSGSRRVGDACYTEENTWRRKGGATMRVGDVVTATRQAGASQLQWEMTAGK